jgi:hypothetical protein
MCGLPVEICNALDAIQSICQRVTAGNFQVHLARRTLARLLGDEEEPRER